LLLSPPNERRRPSKTGFRTVEWYLQPLQFAHGTPPPTGVELTCAMFYSFPIDIHALVPPRLVLPESPFNCLSLPAFPTFFIVRHITSQNRSKSHSLWSDATIFNAFRKDPLGSLPIRGGCTVVSSLCPHSPLHQAQFSPKSYHRLLENQSFFAIDAYQNPTTGRSPGPSDGLLHTATLLYCS